MADEDVTNNRDANRFELQLEDVLAELDYVLRDGSIIFTHTGVPRALEGQGVGSSLARRGLAYAKEQDLVVVPNCPFVRGYIERHPEYKPLTAPRGGGP